MTMLTRWLLKNQFFNIPVMDFKGLVFHAHKQRRGISHYISDITQ